ncbi:hypothetical protein MUO32_11820 [Shinella sp. CPCC 101442]|uniref:hypothetical protein n=1 Tax=Shinella sp. CPCC 101442 TaxID=2932265 RepID=UPI0021520DB0|nr:hypothetical protein [Shinella sp. CPCC 101442]MCR6499726.1 hypothetical protein [Shinella sp. CPCC 101442]
MTQELAPLPEAMDHNALNSIEATALPVAKDIDIGFFSHRARKSTQLVGNSSEENFIKARREWMDFDFIDIIYVTKITVSAFGYEEYHELELSYKDYIVGSTKNEAVRYSDGKFIFNVNRFIGGFGLKPNERFFKDSKLTKITVEGIEQNSFSDVISILDGFEGYRRNVEDNLNLYLKRAQKSEEAYKSLASKIEDLQELLSSQGDQFSDLEASIADHSEILENRKKEIAIAESVTRNLNEENQRYRNNVDRLTKDSENLSKDISEKESRLRSLVSDINLFPTEISGYVSQGARNVSVYAWLCAVPLIVIMFVTGRLFWNSEKLINLDFGDGFDVVDFIVSRSPYVIISAVVLAVCYTVLHRLITEIIGINRRRQDLFKVSIIATDVSNASQNNLDIPLEDVYNLRTQVKMELLKEHLRRHIGEDFVYNPKSSLFHKLTSKIAGQIASEEKDVE